MQRCVALSAGGTGAPLAANEIHGRTQSRLLESYGASPCAPQTPAFPCTWSCAAAPLPRTLLCTGKALPCGFISDAAMPHARPSSFVWPLCDWVCRAETSQGGRWAGPRLALNRDGLSRITARCCRQEETSDKVAGHGRLGTAACLARRQRGQRHKGAAQHSTRSCGGGTMVSSPCQRGKCPARGKRRTHARPVRAKAQQSYASR